MMSINRESLSTFFYQFFKLLFVNDRIIIFRIQLAKLIDFILAFVKISIFLFKMRQSALLIAFALVFMVAFSSGANWGWKYCVSKYRNAYR